MPPRKFIALIGLRCSGKTTVGTEFARILRLPFIDLDREIERIFARASEGRDVGEMSSTPTGSPRSGSVPTSTLASSAHPTSSPATSSVPTSTRPPTSAPQSSAPTSAVRPTSRPPANPPGLPPRTAGEILQSQGEPAFRALESEALTEILRRETPCVLATGGGVVEREENRRALAEHAVCIWLRVDAAELARRMRADPTPRPSLTGLTGEDPASEIPKLALRRDAWYAALAHTTLDGAAHPPEVLAENLARELMSRKDLGLQG